MKENYKIENTNEKYKFLIVVDNGNRDVLPSKLLEKKMREYGHKVICCNKRDFIVTFRDFMPDACVVPRGDWPFVRSLAKYCKVFLMPSEGARLTAETMMSVFVGRLHRKEKSDQRVDQNNNVIENFNHISKVFLWGPQTKEFLVKTNLFTENQLCISGNSRLDIYRHLKKSTDSDRQFTVGVAFSAKTASMFDGNYQYAELLHNLDEKSHLPLVPDGCHWEDYAWRDFAILRHMMRMIKRIINETNYKIIIRVGPLESRKDLFFLTKKYPDRVIIQERSAQLFDFLSDIDCLLTCWSTTGIEAQLMGVPTIGIPFLINRKRLLDHVKPEANGFDSFLRCYHTPESVEEAMLMIEDCRLRRLPVSKDEKFFKEFIRSVYFWPSEHSASKIIADEIMSSMSGEHFQFHLDLVNDFKLPRVFEVLLRVKIFPHKLVFLIVRGLRYIRNLQQDLNAGSFEASRSFHAASSPEAQRLVDQTVLD